MFLVLVLPETFSVCALRIKRRQWRGLISGGEGRKADGGGGVRLRAVAREEDRWLMATLVVVDGSEGGRNRQQWWCRRQLWWSGCVSWSLSGHVGWRMFVID